MGTRGACQIFAPPEGIVRRIGNITNRAGVCAGHSLKRSAYILIDMIFLGHYVCILVSKLSRYDAEYSNLSDDGLTQVLF